MSISSRSAFFPAAPRKGSETGLPSSFLLNLILKTFYYRQEMLGHEVARELHLPFAVVDEYIQHMRREKLLEVGGSSTTATATYRFQITDGGRQRAREALKVSQYVGPAPVPLESYIDGLLAQTTAQGPANRDVLRNALSGLVLPPDVIEKIGPALESQRALFLYGNPGNGKTALAEAIGQAMGGSLLIPYAVEIDSQVIKVMDPIFHGYEPASADATLDGLQANTQAGVFDADDHPRETAVYDETIATVGADRFDERWVEVQRPVVFAGGELDLDMLDLTFNTRGGFYEAPLHMKANGGVFIIDDFGRQLVSPRDLLNRWIVPLDKGVDFLTLHTGRKFPIPFRAMVIFATNLKPHDLADEAFLRRIRYKIEVRNPSREEYVQIFWQACANCGIQPEQHAIDLIYETYYEGMNIPPRCCHPSDLLQKVVETARWQGKTPILDPATLDLVCSSYFLGED